MGDATCSFPECKRQRYSNMGWCRVHHDRWRKCGDPAGGAKMQRVIAERFWAKVEKGADPPACRPDLGSCWVYCGTINNQGYGTFYVDTETGKKYAHRFSYALENGPIPDGLELDHLCRRTACVRPTHLEAVAHVVNANRGISREVNQARFSARTHCKYGHMLDETNTRLRQTKRGICRTCRICARRLDAEARKRRKQKLFAA